ncbi:hypothetical protein Tco_0377119 [Tanacetum coccineum]
MLDKTNYSSWASRMLLYIKGKPNGKLLVDYVLNGPFQYGSIVEPEIETTPATVRARTYTDLTDEEKLRESVDITATNIVLQGLPQDIYNLVNHNEDVKKIWDRVKLLIQGSELSLQERESKLYDDFIFAFHEYLRMSRLRMEQRLLIDFVGTRLIDDLLALDSKVRFDISDRRLELTATFQLRLTRSV